MYSSFEGMAKDFLEKQRVLRTYLSTVEPSRLLVEDMLLSASHSSSRNVVTVSGIKIIVVIYRRFSIRSWGSLRLGSLRQVTRQMVAYLSSLSLGILTF